jgi:hypothetical protein
MMKRLRDDSGVAMVTAILAVMVAAFLAGTGFSLAQHTLQQSGNDRRSVQAVHAAEAGIDGFLRYLSTAPISSTACTLGPVALTSSPASSLMVTATFFPTATSTSPMTCNGSPPALSAVPAATVIRSVGTSSGVSRTMEGYYGLNSLQGGYTLYNGAVYSDGAATFNGQATMIGTPYGADLVSNSNVTLGGGGTVQGSVLVQGALTIKGGTDIKQDAISKLRLDMSGGGIIRGNARSSTADVLMGNNSKVYGNAYYCTGSAPDADGSELQECNPSLPGTKTWSQLAFTYTQSDWTSSPFNYTIHQFNDPNACTNAKAFLSTIAAGDRVVRINSTCTLTYGGHDIVDVKGNLAIISNGGLSMNSQAEFTAAAKKKLFMMFNILTPRPCATTGIAFNSQAMISSTLDALLYTPCQVTFGAQSSTLNGQLVAGAVTFGAGANITSVAVQVPGSNPNGFAQTMKYRREIIGS